MSDPEHIDASADDLVIEVAGDGVHLDTLDAPSFLELGVAYMQLLIRCAADRDEMIEFHGLRAFEKCGSIASRPNDPELARRAVLDAFKLLASWEKPARGLKVAVDRVRAAREALPSHYTASVKVRGLERVLSTEPMSVLEPTPYVIAALRAYVQRVGGTKPRATFSSRAEPRVFHLDLANADQASALGQYLYHHVDIVAVVARNADGNIEEGRLTEFYPVLGGDPRAAWSEWFADNGVASLDELDGNKRGRGRGDGPG
jgi:hypothetical protein